MADPVTSEDWAKAVLKRSGIPVPGEPSPAANTPPPAPVSPQAEAMGESLETPKDPGPVRLADGSFKFPDGTVIDSDGNRFTPTGDPKNPVKIETNLETAKNNGFGLANPTPLPDDIAKAGAGDPAAAKAAESQAAQPTPARPRLYGNPYAPGGGGISAGGVSSTTPPFAAHDAADASVIQSIDRAQSSMDEAARARSQQGADNAAHIGQGIQRLTDLETFKQKVMTDAYAESAQSSKQAEESAKAAASMSVDPNRWYHNNGTAKNIGLAIALGLSEFGSHMPHVSGGGQNITMQLISAAIERDVASQKSNIDQAWKKVSEGRAFAKDAQARADFIAEQTDKLTIGTIKKVDMQMAGAAALADSADKKAAIDQARMQLETMKQSLSVAGGDRRYQFMMARMAGMAAMANKRQEAYRKFYTEELEKNNNDRASYVKEYGTDKGFVPRHIPMPMEFETGAIGGPQPLPEDVGSSGGAAAIPPRNRAAVAKEEETGASDQKTIDLIGQVRSTRHDPSALLPEWASDSTDYVKNEDMARAANAAIARRVADMDSARLAASGYKDKESLLRDLSLDTGNSPERLAARKILIGKALGLGETPLKDQLSGKPKPVVIPGLNVTNKTAK